MEFYFLRLLCEISTCNPAFFSQLEFMIYLHATLLALLICPAGWLGSNSNELDWSSNRRLTWEDFKASPDPHSTNAALTSANIKFEYGYGAKGFTYHIRCLFNKKQSWGRVQTDYILSHEQGHFDIAEISARKLNKLLKEYKPGKPSDISRDISHIYENAMQELDNMQENYDSETQFSINKPKQQEWLEKIRKILSSLESYSSYP